MNQFHDEDVVIQVPAAPRLRQGTKGTGTFSFEALETVGSLVRLKLSGLSYKTESKADVTYRDMIGVNEAPGGMEDEEDDETDVV